MKHGHEKKSVKHFLLIDDDPVFCGLLGRHVAQHGVVLDYYTSLLEFGHIRQHKAYDAVIIDFDLGEIKGPESIGYICGLFGDVPVILISALPESHIQPYLRSGMIRRFVQKSQGPAEIIAAATSYCAQDFNSDSRENPL